MPMQEGIPGRGCQRIYVQPGPTPGWSDDKPPAQGNGGDSQFVPRKNDKRDALP